MTNDHSGRTVAQRALLVIALAFGSASPAFAQCPPTFAPATYVAVGTPYSVGVGDFNNDGRPDIVAARFAGATATVRLASAAFPGAYDGAIDINMGGQQRGCAVADFNHDGIADFAIAAAGVGVNAALTIVISNGNGTFRTPVVYTTPAAAYELKIADFNHDNNPDIAVICGCGGINVHLGNADGTFQPYTSHAAGSNATGLAIGDFTGDGVLDMFIPSYSASNIRGAVGLAVTPTFGSLLTHSNGGYFGPWQAAAGDFNEDGRQDAVVTFRLTSRVAVHLGNTDGTMTPLTGPFTGNQPQDVVSADFNGDGHLDVAVINNGTTPTVAVHLGDGAGGLGGATLFPVAAGPNSLVVADMNSDGKPDIVVACQTAGNIAILLNTSPTFSFTQHPQTKRVCPGGTSGASFTAAATTSVAGGISAYRWERLVGSTWTALANGTLAGVGDISGATLQTLAVANVQGQPGDLVATLRCVATNSCGTLASNVAELRTIRPCGGADVGGVGGVFTGCGDGVLDNNDFVVFIDLFFNGNVLADIGSQGGSPGADGQFNNNDFVVFIDMFFNGCTL